MKQFLLLVITFMSYNLSAQGWYPMGSRSMSMGNASVTLNDVWAFHNNPGALGTLDKITAGVSYENRFLLQELQTQGVAVAIPLKEGVISVGGQTYGYRAFRTYKGGIGYSMPLGEKLFAGVQLNYQGLQLSQNYGSRSTVTGEAGLFAEISEDWHLGVSVFNVGRAKLSEPYDDRFTTLMRLGTSYRFSERFMIALEAEKDLDYDPRIKTGLEYEVLNSFYLRGGFATAPVEFSFGMGYEFGVIQLDAGSAYHQILGWSPNFTLVYKQK